MSYLTVSLYDYYLSAKFIKKWQRNYSQGGIYYTYYKLKYKHVVSFIKDLCYEPNIGARQRQLEYDIIILKCKDLISSRVNSCIILLLFLFIS